MPEPTDAAFGGLRLAGRRVLVAGGSAAVLGPLTRLLAARALVEVVAPHVVAAVRDFAERELLTWRVRDAVRADVEGAWLVVAATGREKLDAALLAAADDRAVVSTQVRDATAVSAAPPAEPAIGRVVLVGGGPGHPGLLTVRGREEVLAADVVVVDRLAPLSVLAELPAHVEVVDVSKIPRGAFTPQERINGILVEQALAGRRVVRFKGGDPFVFGRGMEEAIACREAGIDVEVVPGVTSAVAAPALAGVPVTHRGVVQGFAVVSGHAAPDDPRSTVDWGALARSGLTLVVLMGVETLPAIAAELLAAGRAADTPVASVMDAGLSSQRSVRRTLAALAAPGGAVGISAPAVTVVGDVAAFAESTEGPVGPPESGRTEQRA